MYPKPYSIYLMGTIHWYDDLSRLGSVRFRVHFKVRGLNTLCLVEHLRCFSLRWRPVGLIYIYIYIWAVVKIMVPFWIPIIIRNLIFRVPKKGP